MKINRLVGIPRLSRLMAVLTALTVLASPGLPSAIAASDNDRNLENLGLDASMAHPISDAEMGRMRGRFVADGGQQILYFGLVMQSNLTAQSGNSLSAGLAFGVNFNSGAPKVVTNLTWATQNGSSETSIGSGASASPSPLGGINGGIGQVIQVTGQGNQAFNQATLDLTNSTPGSLLPGGVPTGIPCGGSCQSMIQTNALKVLVDMPGQGSASQSVGPSVILQGIKLNGNMAQATNSMSMVMQLAQTPSFDTLAVSTILQSIPSLQR